MAINYTALAAWAADANAKIELIDRDECWIDVIALTDADAAHMLQKVQSEASGLIYDTGNKRMLERLQRMTRVLQHRTQLGAALVQQRLSTDAALGSLSVLTYDTRQLIVRLAGERAKDLSSCRVCKYCGCGEGPGVGCSGCWPATLDVPHSSRPAAAWFPLRSLSEVQAI